MRIRSVKLDLPTETQKSHICVRPWLLLTILNFSYRGRQTQRYFNVSSPSSRIDNNVCEFTFDNTFIDSRNVVVVPVHIQPWQYTYNQIRRRICHIEVQNQKAIFSKKLLFAKTKRGKMCIFCCWYL